MAELTLLTVQQHPNITDQAAGTEQRKLDERNAHLPRDVTDESLPPRSIVLLIFQSLLSDRH